MKRWRIDFTNEPACHTNNVHLNTLHIDAEDKDSAIAHADEVLNRFYKFHIIKGVSEENE